MTNKAIINTNSAPEALGPYSQAIRVGNLLFISGQIPLNACSEIIGDDIATQTHQVLSNLKVIIEAANMSLANTVKCTCFLKNISDFTAFNAVYAEYFSTSLPTRECVEVARLPKDVLIEISAICVK